MSDLERIEEERLRLKKRLDNMPNTSETQEARREVLRCLFILDEKSKHLSMIEEGIDPQKLRLDSDAPTYQTRCRRPCGGCWYRIPSPDVGWETVSLKESEDPNPSYGKLWRTRVVPWIGEKYRLPVDQVLRVRQLPRALPFGRVISPANDRGVWTISCGGDFASRMSQEITRRRVVAEFRLDRQACEERIKFVASENERMVPEQRAELSRILGVAISY